MLSREFILNNRDIIDRIIKIKNIDINTDELYETIEQRKDLITNLDELRHERNAVSNSIAEIKRAGGDITPVLDKSRSISSRVKENEKTLKELEQKELELLKWIPNIPHPSVPSGKDAVFEVVREKGLFKGSSCKADALMDSVDSYDLKRGTKISGSHFPLFRNKGAYLERVLINFMLDLHIRKHGYEEIFTPFAVSEETLFTTGQLPKLRDDMYSIAGEDLYLIPTAEPPVTAMYNNEILTEDQLPMKFTAYSACFRREAGSYGKETKGLKRVHQFNKVEMVRYTKPEDSYDALEEMVIEAEEVLELLGLDYRTILLPDNDLSFASSKTYDIEVWAPGTGEFLEVSSVSNFEDFQSRRGKIRYKNSRNENQLIHTLNGSGLATPRTVIAIIEQYGHGQDFEFPPVLQDYINKGPSIIENL